jgi:hypothetical protein
MIMMSVVVSIVVPSFILLNRRTYPCSRLEKQKMQLICREGNMETVIAGFSQGNAQGQIAIAEAEE